MKRRNQRGVAMIEFAIVATLLFILLFAIIEFSIILFDKAVITNASREGARRGIVYDPNGTSEEVIKTAVINSATKLISLGGPSSFDEHNITVDPNNCLRPRNLVKCPAGTPLTVTVNYQYHFLILPKFVTQLADLNLSATTVMRME